MRPPLAGPPVPRHLSGPARRGPSPGTARARRRHGADLPRDGRAGKLVVYTDSDTSGRYRSDTWGGYRGSGPDHG